MSTPVKADPGAGVGKSGVKTPWENSTQAPNGVSWTLPGKTKTTWEDNKSRKNGGDETLPQRKNGWAVEGDPQPGDDDGKEINDGTR